MAVVSGQNGARTSHRFSSKANFCVSGHANRDFPSFGPANATVKLRAEGRAFMPTAQDFLHPWQSKKREPKEPSASTDCWTAVKPKDYLLLIFASCVESLKSIFFLLLFDK